MDSIAQNTESDTESIRKEAYEQGYTDGRKKHEVEVYAIAYTNGKQEELGIQRYFKKGEEVIDADGTKAVILRVSEDNYCQVYTEKGCIENWHIHTYKFHKTGRCFTEIAEVLTKMRGK